MSNEYPHQKLAAELVDAALSVIDRRFSNNADEQACILIAQAYVNAGNQLQNRAYALLQDCGLDEYDINDILEGGNDE